MLSSELDGNKIKQYLFIFKENYMFINFDVMSKTLLTLILYFINNRHIDHEDLLVIETIIWDLINFLMMLMYSIL